jgi:electron transfer flavoprotein alpha subunit
MNFVVVLQACTPGPITKARELNGFLHGPGFPAGNGTTVLFHDGVLSRPELLALAPTPAAILVQVTRHQPEQVLGLLEELAPRLDAELYLFPDDLAGRELAVRLACRLRGTSLAGVRSLRVDPDGFRCTRTAYSGQVEAAWRLKRRPCCLVVAKGGVEPLDLSPGARLELELDRRERPGAWIEALAATPAPPPAGLEQAGFLLAAGRGAGSRDRTARLAAIALELGADFGVSRPVAMNAWASMDRLVGVSGAMTRPALAIVAGASGSAAFLAGVERSRFLVAINTDHRAPMLRCADVGVVGDGLAILEELARLAGAAKPRGTVHD